MQIRKEQRRNLYWVKIVVKLGIKELNDIYIEFGLDRLTSFNLIDVYYIIKNFIYIFKKLLSLYIQMIFVFSVVVMHPNGIRYIQFGIK